MLETNETGQKLIEELLKNRMDPIFNEWERGFIKHLAGVKYQTLTKDQKACITRLIGWLRGDD